MIFKGTLINISAVFKRYPWLNMKEEPMGYVERAQRFASKFVAKQAPQLETRTYDCAMQKSIGRAHGKELMPGRMERKSKFRSDELTTWLGKNAEKKMQEE
jgi:hypothetical protein